MGEMQSDVLISVIVPVYNAKDYVFPCIETIIAQKCSNIEIILIDDGSQDGTSEVCDEVSKKYSIVRVIHTKNMGVSNARNLGIESAIGKYITFVDVDDTLENGMFEQLVSDLEQNDCDMSCIGYREIHVDSNQVVEKFGTKEFYVWTDPLKEFLTDIKISWMVWGKMYKRELIKDIRFPIGKAIAEDMYFVFQVCQRAKKVCYRDESLYQYAIHDKSVMGSTISQKNFDVPQLIKRVYDETTHEYPEKCDEAKRFLLRYMLWFHRFVCIKIGTEEIFSKELKQVKDVIVKYNVRQAFQCLNKKYFAEYLLVRFVPGLYRRIVKYLA